MKQLTERVSLALRQVPVVDIHTHLYPPQFGALNLWGIDELLTYHYLIAETLRAEPTVTPEALFALSKPDQADLIWQALFVRRTPVSEAAVGVVRVMCALGLDPSSQDLSEARAFYCQRTVEEHVDDVLTKSGVSTVVMTNDPLDAAERRMWDAIGQHDTRFKAVLRLDPILDGWRTAAPLLVEDGYSVQLDLGGETIDEVRRYLDTWIVRMNACYVAVSLPDNYAYPESTARDRLLRDAVLPACVQHGIPIAMMIGVRRAANPRLQSAGDGYGVADLSSIQRLASDFPSNRFLVTTLARENSYGLCVAARKFANILPFGCWWFMNNPLLVEETTQMRLEMLGTTFVPQHSDARVLDQLLYKWPHARLAIEQALVKRYGALESAGRAVDGRDIERDVKLLMSDNAKAWLGID